MGIGSLFDAGPRYGGPGLYSESQFAFLNRRDGAEWQRVRDLLESWYVEHPDPDGGLRARFREFDIRQHAGAWWELYTFILFRRLGYEVTVDPTILGGTGRPDFVVTRADSRMYVECVVLFEDGSRHSTDSEAWLKDCIDIARNPDFMVSLKFERFGTLRPRRRQITRQIEDWLASLDYDSVRKAASEDEGYRFPSRSFDFVDWRVKLTALPVSPDARGDDMGRIGIGPSSGAFPVTSVDEIRQALKDKAKQCRGVRAPLIVAILNWTTFASQREVEQALFGSEAIRHNTRSAAQLVRSADGYWYPGPRGRGSSVSAVMFGEHIHTSRVAAELPTLWLNPWAKMPLLEQLPFSTHTAHDTGEVFRSREASTSPDALFDLPSDWPGFAAAGWSY